MTAQICAECQKKDTFQLSILLSVLWFFLRNSVRLINFQWCPRRKWRVVYSFKQTAAGVHVTLWANCPWQQISWVFFLSRIFWTTCISLVGENTGLQFHKFVHKWIPMKKHQLVFNHCPTGLVQRWNTTSSRKMSRNCWKVGKLPWCRVSASSWKFQPPKNQCGSCGSALEPIHFGVPCHLFGGITITIQWLSESPKSLFQRSEIRWGFLSLEYSPL